MIRLILLFVLIATSWCDVSAEEPPGVYFVPGNVSAEALAEAEAVWRRAAPLVKARIWHGERPPLPIKAELLSTKEFQARTAGVIGDWGVGLASDRWLAVDVGRMKAVGQMLSHVLMHELAHCLMAQAMPGVRGVPLWFHEGVAQHVAGEWRIRDTVSLVIDGGVMRLRDLEQRFPDDAGGVDRAYRTSLLAVRRLEERFGRDVVRDIIAAADAGGEFPEAFMAVTGVSLGEFGNDFAARTKLRYGWLLMLARWPTMFVLMAVIFLVGGALKIRRDRRRMAEMPDGEDDAPWQDRGRLH